MVEAVDGRLEEKLLGLKVQLLRVDVVGKGPVVVPREDVISIKVNQLIPTDHLQPVPDLLVNGTHRLHVVLAPLPPEKLGLHLEQLQRVHLEHRLPHPKTALQRLCTLEEDQHHDAAVLPLGQLVENAQQVDGAK